MSLYSVVVPVYNSEHTLEELYRRLEKVFREVIKEDFELAATVSWMFFSEPTTIRTWEPNGEECAYCKRTALTGRSTILRTPRSAANSKWISKKWKGIWESELSATGIPNPLPSVAGRATTPLQRWDGLIIKKKS